MPALALIRSALAAALLLAAGCTAEAPPGTVVVNMYDNAYSPPRVRVPEGGRVVFKNLGRNQHHAVGPGRELVDRRELRHPGDDAVARPRLGGWPRVALLGGGLAVYLVIVVTAVLRAAG